MRFPDEPRLIREASFPLAKGRVRAHVIRDQLGYLHGARGAQGTDGDRRLRADRHRHDRHGHRPAVGTVRRSRGRRAADDLSVALRAGDVRAPESRTPTRTPCRSSLHDAKRRNEEIAHPPDARALVSRTSRSAPPTTARSRCVRRCRRATTMGSRAGFCGILGAGIPKPRSGNGLTAAPVRQCSDNAVRVPAHGCAALTSAIRYLRRRRHRIRTPQRRARRRHAWDAPARRCTDRQDGQPQHPRLHGSDGRGAPLPNRLRRRTRSMRHRRTQLRAPPHTAQLRPITSTRSNSPGNGARCRHLTAARFGSPSGAHDAPQRQYPTRIATAS